jgi:hypothetical protein
MFNTHFVSIKIGIFNEEVAFISALHFLKSSSHDDVSIKAIVLSGQTGLA